LPPKEKVISFKEAESHPVVQEEELQYMDMDTSASACSGEARREIASPCFTPEEDYQVQRYARGASPDFAARFQKPVWRASDVVGMDIGEVAKYVSSIQPETKKVEKAEQEFREHRAKVKEWLREGEEESIRWQEEQRRIWDEGRLRRLREAERRQREEEEAGEKRQLEEKTRNEVAKQLKEKRSNEEKWKKEEKERRDEEMRKKDEEARRRRDKEVE
jgi:hypothetical protein